MFGFLTACTLLSYAGEPGQSLRLPEIGTAPHFNLIDQDGEAFSSRKMLGRVSVVTFIFTTCSAACPILTAKLVDVQRRLKNQKHKVLFTAVTVDPMNDTPEVLKKYARAHSVDPQHFAFLTGPQSATENLAMRYAVYSKKAPDGAIDHTFLTSIIDRKGTIRVQYLGTRFDQLEFIADIQSLLSERDAR